MNTILAVSYRACIAVSGVAFVFLGMVAFADASIDREAILRQIADLRAQILQLQQRQADQCAQVTIEWSPVQGAERYEVRRDGVHVHSGSETRFTDTDRVRGRSYSYDVRSVNRAGESRFTTRLVVTARDMCPPPAPAQFELRSHPCGGAVTLEWQDAPRADRYRLSRGRTVVFEGSRTRFVETGLRFDRRHTYTLEAGNQSGWSEPQTVRGRSSDICPPDAPTEVRTVPLFEEGIEGLMIVSLGDRPRDDTRVRPSRSFVRVASYDVEARFSDMTIDRVDISFDTDPRRHISRVRVGTGFGNRRIVDISNENVSVIRRGSHYQVRVTGLSFAVSEGRSRSLQIDVDARDDDGRAHPHDVVVFLDNRAIRATDTARIIHHLPLSDGGPGGAFERSFVIR